jgi:Fe-S-cluster-containing dehydrogenase component
MKNISRRSFIRNSALISASALTVTSKTKGASETEISEERFGVLVDTTLCIGCRRCEWACKEAHHLENKPVDTYDNRSVLKTRRRPDNKSLTVVNEYENENKENSLIDVKVQCMHCDKPACVSACIVSAFKKLENGAVVWNGNKCIGCRYCMIACPFQIPAYDYDKAVEPEVKKCDFCYERLAKDKLPACVEICPAEALVFGKRIDLVSLARNKIKIYPERYSNHVFGETEVGGTSWLYLANKDFTKIGFPKLGKSPAPGVSESIQHGLFAYFVPPIALYALLGGIMWLNKRKENTDKEE